MFTRIGRIIKLASAPVSGWKSGWQKMIALLAIIGLPALSQIAKVHLPLRDALEYSLILALLAVFLAAYRIQKQLDQVVDAMPKLVCKGASSHDNPIVVTETEMAGSPLVRTARQRIVGV